MSRYRINRLKICNDKRCKHHIASHTYDPADQGRKPPATCIVPGCPCKRFKRKSV